MTEHDTLERHLRPGHVYRRQELAQWSKAVDRDLKRLVLNGTLTKVASGVYARPKKTAFGDAPASDNALIKSFLKDDHFVVATPNAYNGLGGGTTQLYNRTVVYNHKRHGAFTLGGRTFEFRVRPRFPNSLNKEFLLVDLVNNIDQLAESRDEVLKRVEARVTDCDARKLKRAATNYGNVRTKKFFARLAAPEPHVA